MTPPAPSPRDRFAQLLAQVKYDRDGLVPVVAQDAGTGVVRMVAWSNAQALQATLTSGDATFWSRSRQALWRKGAESGHVMHVRQVRVDCDGDTVLYLCDPVGPSCHTGKTSCFYRGSDLATGGGPTVAAPDLADLIEDDGPAEVSAAILPRLARVIAERRQQPADKSYVASLLAKGFPKIGAKIIEEAGEVTEALPTGDRAHITHEAADLLFHLMVGMEAAGVGMDDVFAELRRRFGIGGHVEKAARTSGPGDPPPAAS